MKIKLLWIKHKIISNLLIQSDMKIKIKLLWIKHEIISNLQTQNDMKRRVLVNLYVLYTNFRFFAYKHWFTKPLKIISKF